jgi:cytochrome P450 family 12
LILESFSIILNYVNEAVENLKLRDKNVKDDHELSILEKLLKIDKNVAIVMSADMMLAGVDTVVKL